jgi:hypothetical protein
MSGCVAIVVALVVGALNLTATVDTGVQLLSGRNPFSVDWFVQGVIYQVLYHCCMLVMLVGLAVAGASFAMKTKRGWSIAGCVINGVGLYLAWGLSKLM